MAPWFPSRLLLYIRGLGAAIPSSCGRHLRLDLDGVDFAAVDHVLEAGHDRAMARDGLLAAKARRDDADLELAAVGREGAAVARALADVVRVRRVLDGAGEHALDLCRNQPLVWVVLTKLENSLARSNRS